MRPLPRGCRGCTRRPHPLRFRVGAVFRHGRFACGMRARGRPVAPRGSVAQRLEQATHNRPVAGSNPAGPILLPMFLPPGRPGRPICPGHVASVILSRRPVISRGPRLSPRAKAHRNEYAARFIIAGDPGLRERKQGPNAKLQWAGCAGRGDVRSARVPAAEPTCDRRQRSCPRAERRLRAAGSFDRRMRRLSMESKTLVESAKRDTVLCSQFG